MILHLFSNVLLDKVLVLMARKIRARNKMFVKVLVRSRVKDNGKKFPEIFKSSSFLDLRSITSETKI